MQIGLQHLIADELAAHAEEARRLNAESRGSERPPDPTTPEALAQARAALPPRPAPPGPPAVERPAVAAGRQVPVRITTPTTGAPSGVYLEIHGAGFYLGSAARSDARNR